jgi:hypothetical protein
VPFIVPGPIADRETLAAWRVAMMKINHPARAADRAFGLARRTAPCHLGGTVVGPTCPFPRRRRRHGLAARASIRQSRQTELLSVTPNYALFGDDTHRLEDLSGD